MPFWEGELPKPSLRTIGEMRAVLADPSCECSDPLYTMYRDLARSDADRMWLRDHALRYDITVIPPRDLCGERVKTKGHYHPDTPGGTGYPEIYEILGGEAQYLLQDRRIEDVVIVSAMEGDIVIIPPGYGHISINPSEKAMLVMANIVSTAFQSDYREYESRHGAAYYVMSSGKVKRNPHYGAVPPIRYIGATCPGGVHPLCRAPLYDLIGKEEALRFLNEPEKYREVFSVLLKD